MVELNLNSRELELVKLVLGRRRVGLRELEDTFSKQWGVSAKAVYQVIHRLVEREVLRRKRGRDKKLYVEPHPKFVGLILTLYNLLYAARPEYVQRKEREIERTAVRA